MRRLALATLMMPLLACSASADVLLITDGEVWDIGYLGDFSVFIVRLDDGRMFRAAQANVARLVDRPITFGDMVWLSWSADAGLVLTR